MRDNLISSDGPLTDSQRNILAALLGTVLPPSADGRMPGADEIDLAGYLVDKDPQGISLLVDVIARFDAAFVELDPAARHQQMQAFSEAEPMLFQGLLFHTYAAYYQDPRALKGIGMVAGPPFPQGNTVEAGDLSLLEPVSRSSKGYRRA